jgi:tripartite-type tricarboxylate transporter receptor subunit TctC
MRSVLFLLLFACSVVADSSARVISERLGARLGQSVVVENRPGASGNIGTHAVTRLQKDIAAVLAEPEIRERYATLGIKPVGNLPEEFGGQIRADLARWEKVVRQAGIRIE